MIRCDSVVPFDSIISCFIYMFLMQYDLSVSTFSPDGRVFQAEYAQKAVDSSG